MLCHQCRDGTHSELAVRVPSYCRKKMSVWNANALSPLLALRKLGPFLQSQQETDQADCDTAAEASILASEYQLPVGLALHPELPMTEMRCSAQNQIASTPG